MFGKDVKGGAKREKKKRRQEKRARGEPGVRGRSPRRKNRFLAFSRARWDMRMSFLDSAHRDLPIRKVSLQTDTPTFLFPCSKKSVRFQLLTVMAIFVILTSWVPESVEKQRPVRGCSPVLEIKRRVFGNTKFIGFSRVAVIFFFGKKKVRCAPWLPKVRSGNRSIKIAWFFKLRGTYPCQQLKPDIASKSV